MKWWDEAVWNRRGMVSPLSEAIVLILANILLVAIVILVDLSLLLTVPLGIAVAVLFVFAVGHLVGKWRGLL